MGKCMNELWRMNEWMNVVMRMLGIVAKKIWVYARIMTSSGLGGRGRESNKSQPFDQ